MSSVSEKNKRVFISHSSLDDQAVGLVCEALESSGFGCWFSGRDIGPNERWADAITQGLQKTELVVLVLSENSAKSDEVLKELTLASQMKMPIITFRIDKVKPQGGLEYHLSIDQWVPAASPPNDRQLQSLVGAVDRRLLDLKGSWLGGGKDSRKRNLPLLGLALAAIALFGFWGTQYLRDRGDNNSEDVIPSEQTALNLANVGHDTSGADSMAAAGLDTVGFVQDIGEATGDGPAIMEELPPPPVDTRGKVTLNSHPRGASVYLNGDKIGTTPMRDHKLAAGSYTARFRLAGYQTEVRSVDIRPGSGSVVDVTLSRKQGALEVISIPSSAEVVLDGSRIGTTPCTFDRLTIGSHVVVVKKDGFVTRQDTVNLRADSPFVHEVRLERLVGYLTITVIPSGSIAINGDPKANDSNVPYTTLLRPGSYEVEARHVIYGTWRKAVEIANGDEKNLVFDFSEKVDIIVTSTPNNAAIYVNDRFRGCYTPYTISVRPGLRKIDVRLDGYHSLGAKELSVDGNMEDVVRFEMRKGY